MSEQDLGPGWLHSPCLYLHWPGHWCTHSSFPHRLLSKNLWVPNVLMSPLLESRWHGWFDHFISIKTLILISHTFAHTGSLILYCPAHWPACFDRAVLYFSRMHRLCHSSYVVPITSELLSPWGWGGVARTCSINDDHRDTSCAPRSSYPTFSAWDEDTRHLKTFTSILTGRLQLMGGLRGKNKWYWLQRGRNCASPII